MGEVTICVVHLVWVTPDGSHKMGEPALFVVFSTSERSAGYTRRLNPHFVWVTPDG